MASEIYTGWQAANNIEDRKWTGTRSFASLPAWKEHTISKVTEAEKEK